MNWAIKVDTNDYWKCLPADKRPSFPPGHRTIIDWVEADSRSQALILAQGKWGSLNGLSVESE